MSAAFQDNPYKSYVSDNSGSTGGNPANVANQRGNLSNPGSGVAGGPSKVQESTPPVVTHGTGKPAAVNDMSGIDWNSIFGIPQMQFGMGGGYPGAMGMGNGYTPHSALSFFQNWDNWRRQMMSQNFYLPALGATNFGY